MGRGEREPAELTRVRAADDVWGVSTYVGGAGEFRRFPCRTCPWRRDAEVGAFPAEAFRHSAETAYDMSTHTFGCHSHPDQPHTCAGFLLRGASDNLSVRLRDQEFVGVYSEVALYSSYREMAEANGVDPDDPVLDGCRGDRERLESRDGRWRIARYVDRKEPEDG